MLRRIALLTTAILAIAAMGATMAASAAAKEQVGVFVSGEESENEEEQPRFAAESYPAYLDGYSSGNLRWDVPAGPSVEAIECPLDFFGELSSATASLTLSKFVYYFSCKTMPEGFTVTVINAGCEDTFGLFNSGPPYMGTFGNQCGEEGYFTFNLGSLCTVTLPHQLGLEDVSYETTGAGSERAIQASLEVEGLHYTVGGFAPFCGNGEYTEGSYSGTVVLEGFDE